MRQARRAYIIARKMLVFVTRVLPGFILHREAQFAISVRTTPVLQWAVQAIQIADATQVSLGQMERNATRVCRVITRRTMVLRHAPPVRPEKQAIIIMRSVRTRAKVVLQVSTVPRTAQTAQNATTIPRQRMKVPA